MYRYMQTFTALNKVRCRLFLHLTSHTLTRRVLSPQTYSVDSTESQKAFDSPHRFVQPRHIGYFTSPSAYPIAVQVFVNTLGIRMQADLIGDSNLDTRTQQTSHSPFQHGFKYKSHGASITVARSTETVARKEGIFIAFQSAPQVASNYTAVKVNCP